MTLHGQAQAIRELASVLPAQYVRQVLPASSAGGIAPLTGAAASLTRKAITPAIASGAAACVIAARDGAGRDGIAAGRAWECGRTGGSRAVDSTCAGLIPRQKALGLRHRR